MKKGTIPWVLAAGLSIVLLILFLNNQKKRSANTPLVTESPLPTAEAENTADSTRLMVLPGTSALFVSDQKPGNHVTISSVVFATQENAEPDSGFVVIHTSENGQPGEIIGVSEYIQGSKDMLEIPLVNATGDGEEYIAMLHKDDGNQKWDGPDTDLPVSDDQGNTTMMIFNVTRNAEEPSVISM